MKPFHKPVVYRMRLVLSIWLLLALLLSGCAETSTKAPEVPDQVVFRPTFETPYGEFSAGTAFAVKWEDGSTLILTAMHIFGPAGGLDRDVLPEEMPYFITRVILQDTFDGNAAGAAHKALVIPEAKPFPAIAYDLAAFAEVSGETMAALSFAQEPVKAGDKVWLCASVLGGAPASQKLHEAIVVESTEEMIYFEYQNSQLTLRATSGSPILNAAGQVIGVNIGAGSAEGSLYGYANPTASILKLLKSTSGEE